MMDIREFREKIKEELPGYMPEELVESITLESVEISKMNDQKLYGITVKEKGSNMAPTLYVNEFYERYQDGEDLEQLITEFAERTEGSVHVQGPPETDLTWDSVKDISNEQLSYITNVDAGHGLLKVGSNLVPFENKFPTDTKLYRLMTTKISDLHDGSPVQNASGAMPPDNPERVSAVTQEEQDEFLRRIQEVARNNDGFKDLVRRYMGQSE